jgi:hypothetical protein
MFWLALATDYGGKREWRFRRCNRPSGVTSRDRWVDYLQHPLIDSFYQRPQAELSRLFWDTVPADLPSAKLTGLQNLAGLCQVRCPLSFICVYCMRNGSHSNHVTETSDRAIVALTGVH